jgi:endonuclease I
MMMFMYVRYGSRCLPNNVGIGNAVAGDANMIDLFLQWNAEDPVNFFEDNRNVVIAGIQGNRNPFIDNPALATQIWGGPQAEDRFGSGGTGSVADLFIFRIC